MSTILQKDMKVTHHISYLTWDFKLYSTYISALLFYLPITYYSLKISVNQASNLQSSHADNASFKTFKERVRVFLCRYILLQIISPLSKLQYSY